MNAQTVATAERLFQVSGVGYDPHAAFSLNGRDLLATEYPELLELSSAGVLCNDASLRLVNGDWQLNGDPTEGALLGSEGGT
jgi:magnesium-transporting ATPase (P-type)